MAIRFPKGEIPRFATDSNYPVSSFAWSGLPVKSALSSAEQAAGFAPKQEPPVQKLNDWMHRAGRYIETVPEMALRNWPYSSMMTANTGMTNQPLFINTTNHFGQCLASFKLPDYGSKAHPQGVWVVGGARSAAAIDQVCFSADKGRVWQTMPSTSFDSGGETLSLYGDSFSGTTVWLVGSGAGPTETHVMRSTNMGQSWTYTTVTGATNYAVTAISRVLSGASPSNFLVGVEPNANATVIYTSADGASWTSRSTPWTGIYVNGFACNNLSSGNVVVAIGESPTQVLRSTDGGQSWTAATFDGSSGVAPVGVSYNEELGVFVLFTFASNEMRTYYSVDGQSWNKTVAASLYVSIPTQTSTRGKLVASFGRYILVPGMKDIGGTGPLRFRNGIYYSGDLGATWRFVTFWGAYVSTGGVGTAVSPPEAIAVDRGQIMVSGKGWAMGSTDIGYDETETG